MRQSETIASDSAATIDISVQEQHHSGVITLVLEMMFMNTHVSRAVCPHRR
jgi:hypothetical protein